MRLEFFTYRDVSYVFGEYGFGFLLFLIHLMEQAGCLDRPSEHSFAYLWNHFCSLLIPPDFRIRFSIEFILNKLLVTEQFNGIDLIHQEEITHALS